MTDLRRNILSDSICSESISSNPINGLTPAGTALAPIPALNSKNPAKLTVGSLFSGIGGLDLGFERVGFITKWQVEIDRDCRQVLSRHFPTAELFEDVSSVGSRELAPVDVICAGVPCQDVSVAGKRAGLAGKRTGLFYEFARILQELRPTWFVFENVPGLFSSNRGRDFAEVLRVLMVECGYGVCWRVLNSQFFGVAQRRRRVFIVGRLGKPCPAAVLFEPSSSGWNSEAGEETGADFTGPLGGGAYGTGRRTEDDPNLAVTLSAGSGGSSNRPGRRREDDFNLVANSITCGTGRVGSRGADDGTNIVRQAISSKWAKGSSGPAGDEHHNLVATLNSGGNTGGFRTEPGEHIIPIDMRQVSRGEKFTNNRSAGSSGGAPGIGVGKDGDPAFTVSQREQAVAFALQRDPGGIGQGHNTTFVRSETDTDGVRDFAGLPEGMDSRRYRQLGNAVTVTVATWIGQRILEAEALNA